MKPYDKHLAAYFDSRPSYKRLKADLCHLEDNCPDYVYHFSYASFGCCIIRNYSAVSGLFGSYSVKVLGLPPYLGSWRVVANGSLHDCKIAFRNAVAAFLNGEYDVPEL